MKIPTVTPELCTAPKWPFPTDLPRNKLDAKRVLEDLAGYGLAQRSSEGYEATDAGRKVIAKANKAKLWYTAKSES